MKKAPEYLLAILPPPYIIELIAQWKKSLEKEVGWFSSVNAVAHITIDNFDCTADELDLRLKKIRQFCDNAMVQKIHFNRFDSFPPNTFYIAPDEQSEIYLNQFIRNFHNAVYGKSITAKAHMTIARRLDEIRSDTPKLDKPRLNYALDMFRNKEVDIDFLHDSLVLRRHDGKQYNIFIEKFELKGNPPLTLF